MDPVLQIEHVSKVFPGVKALSDVHFDVRPGEVHALLGENGAGKSTLIKIISGVYAPDSGQVLVAGQPQNFHNPREAQAAGIATIYQELSLYPELTVAENIFMGHAPRRFLRLLDWGAMRERARDILSSLNIHDMDVGRKVGTMSVGNRQRVEIAKALSQDARILIMDEPTAALGEADVTRLFSIVRLLRDRGVGIIYISHRLQEVFELADRVTVLRDGVYVGTTDVAKVTEPELITMMVGRKIDDLFPKLPSEVGEPVLEVRGLNRRPNTRDVSFTLRAGEIVGLAGLVGSGRSELAQTIFGFTPSESGEIHVRGKLVTIRHPAEAMSMGIAYVPEDRGSQGLVRPMRVRENVSMAVLKELSRASFIQRKGERSLALQTVELLRVRTSSIEQVVGRLSGGNQQKVVVGKWLAAKPRILIMDEPTRGIDVGAKAEIHRLMSELAQQGLAVLMISSELPEVMGMSDRILVMRDGRLVAEYSRAEATQEKIAAAMMSDTPADTGLDPAAHNQPAPQGEIA
ncbi:MAG TPA: sugar ABC transporter ATP-binding protein [Candidatus Limnocylindrales bacterium]|nr:sugar ABC transporter ATP-binding protein [Candidatus Limnocylindrales bacterium]